MINMVQTSSCFLSLRERAGVRATASAIPASIQPWSAIGKDRCCWASLTPALSRREREQGQEQP